MQKVLYSILFFTLITVLGNPVLGQGPRGRLGDMFQGQLPPPGAVSVLGRSFVGALENGFGNPLIMLMAADDQNIRQEIGMTDAEVNSIQLLRTQMLMNAPKYAARFRTMTEEDQKSIQEDLGRDLGRITEFFDKSLETERKAKVQKFMFQSLGGLDSPIIGLGAMEALELSDDQRKKLQSVFADAREERMAHLETMLEMTEKVIAAGGPQNLSEEEREQLNKKRQELEAQSFATAKKLAERLRQYLTPEQLEREKQLIASRPAFLPGLPRQMQREENTGEGGIYTPGVNSWQPGQALPVQIQTPRSGRFPTSDTE